MRTFYGNKSRRILKYRVIFYEVIKIRETIFAVLFF